MRAATREARATLVLLGLSLAVWVALAALRGSLSSVRGDEGTFLAMAASLALDGDLAFDRRDAARLEAAEGAGRQTVILQRHGEGVAYSKPVLYPLLAAPFYRLLGEAGPMVLNVLALAAAAALAWRYLRRRGSPEGAASTLAAFLAAGVLPAYLAWRMSETLQVALALAGGVLCLAALRPPPPGGGPGRRLDAPWAALLGGGLLGLLVAARLPNLLVAAAPPVALLLAGRRRRAAAALAGGLAAFGLAALLSGALIGTANPYRAVRASFTRSTGYPQAAGPGAVEGKKLEEHFEAHRATQTMGLRPALQPAVSAYSGLYFFVGRHTGIVFYLPAALALGLWSLRRPSGGGLVLLGAAAALALFYLVWLPGNYFGGATFLGNRYVLAAYPLLLLALPSLPPPRVLAPVWALAAVVAASALLSAARAGDAGSQSHAHAGLFRLLPYESTAPNIEGRKDRYWELDLIRFVDPYAAVHPDSFVLRSGRPGAEIEIVSRQPLEAALFRVRSRSAGLLLAATDWRGRRVHSLPEAGAGTSGLVRVPLAPAWRRHSFWWDPREAFRARTVRLALRGGEPDAPARLYYAGDAAVLDGLYVRRVIRAALPSRAEAGAAGSLRIVVQNMSPYMWRRGGVLPVALGYRLSAVDGERTVAGRTFPLPRDVASGEPVGADLPIEWPAEPGLYRLAVDLSVDGAGTFGERVGEPVAAGEVRVEAREPADG